MTGWEETGVRNSAKAGCRIGWAVCSVLVVNRIGWAANSSGPEASMTVKAPCSWVRKIGLDYGRRARLA